MSIPNYPRRDNPKVSLVFPPLVTTNFGNYFPSTAVLAAYLSTNGITSEQADLNEDFMDYLLKPEHLAAVGNGTTIDGRHILDTSIEAVAARILGHSRHLLFNAQGRHLSIETVNSPIYLLTLLADAYRIDLPVHEITSETFHNGSVANMYRAFFTESDYLKRLPTSVHTVGISIPMGPQLGPALILARTLKSIYPDITIVVGGPTLSLMALESLTYLLDHEPSIDAVVRFDGERPLLTLVTQKESGIWNPGLVAGVSSNIMGKVTHHSSESGLPLKDLPYAEYDVTLMARLADPEIGIVQARGCYWGKCAYCDFIELYKGSPPYRIRSPKQVVDEMEYQLRRHGVSRFSLITEALPASFAAKMSNLIIDRGMNIQWSSFAMVEKHFTQELFSLMNQAGCEYLVIGAETMTDRVLALVNKFARQEDNIRFFLAAQQQGVKLRVNLIPDLPSTTYEESLRSLELFRDLAACFDTVSIFPFEATRSSAVGRSPEQYGLQVIEDGSIVGQAQYASNHLANSDPAMTDEQRREVHAAYYAFASEVHENRNRNWGSVFLVEDEQENQLLRLAEEFLDIVHSPEESSNVQCYNWITHQRLELTPDWLTLFEELRRSGSFYRQDFIKKSASPAIREALFRKLVKYRMLSLVQIDVPVPNRSNDSKCLAEQIQI
jgi:radical SAM superfamily enzyme YgiQ (UPF0313 family)